MLPSWMQSAIATTFVCCDHFVVDNMVDMGQYNVYANFCPIV